MIGRTGYRVFFSIVISLFAVGYLLADSDWVYAAAGNRYAVIDPLEGDVVIEGVLATADFAPGESDTPVIAPTPGGRYVFILFPSHDVAIVMDAETHRPAWSVDLPSGTDAIQFSSMGNEIYTRSANGNWFWLPHRRGEVTGDPTSAPNLGMNRVAFNRRATRVYGNSGDSLVYLLTNSGDEVREIGLQAGPYDWVVSPNYRFLVGSGEERVALIDEQRARVVGYLDGGFVPGGALFDNASSRVYALTADGGEIVVADTRRFRELERIETPENLAAIWRSTDKLIHGYSPPANDGSSTGKIVFDLLGSPRTVTIPSSLADGAAPVTASLVSIKPGQGFACF